MAGEGSWGDGAPPQVTDRGMRKAPACLGDHSLFYFFFSAHPSLLPEAKCTEMRTWKRLIRLHVKK